MQVLKGVVGQCAFQLAVMGAIVFNGDAIFYVPNAAEIGSDASLLHGTLVFNTFVCLQLFNQVNPSINSALLHMLRQPALKLYRKYTCGLSAALP